MIGIHGICPLVFVEKTYLSQPIKGEGVPMVDLISIILNWKRYNVTLYIHSIPFRVP
jgi:hypothetical protein